MVILMQLLVVIRILILITRLQSASINWIPELTPKKNWIQIQL